MVGGAAGDGVASIDNGTDSWMGSSKPPAGTGGSVEAADGRTDSSEYPAETDGGMEAADGWSGPPAQTDSVEAADG